jgi:hypothetical protein
MLLDALFHVKKGLLARLEECYVVLDIVGGPIFSKMLNIKTWGNNHSILKSLGWILTSKIYSPSFHGIYEITTFKHQSFFFWDVSICCKNK